MAVGIRNDLPGVTQEAFDSLNKQVDMASDPPAGLIFHASGPTRGGWGVIAFWESREAFDAFIPRIQQAAEAAGIQLQGPPDITEFPVHETFSRG
jgi:catechol 2,3-dioxygenase-like lactoylglutathione lyase family enzyme